MNSKVQSFLVTIVTLVLSTTAFARIIEEGYAVRDPQGDFLNEVKRHPDLVIDHVHKGSFEVWGPHGLGKWLKGMNAEAQAVDSIETTRADDYLTHDQVTAELKAIAQTYPKTTKLFSIGKSTKGRDLWVMKVSRNASVDDNRPEFKYIANMHGDEIVGRELMLKLIKDLVTNDQTDAEVTKLLDSVQIYIMPSMNPDGAAARTRWNAQNIDLNRDFPDKTTSDNANTPDGRATETQLVMKWQATRNFKLSANFHGGAEVVNYPWDAIPQTHPAEPFLKMICLEYAKNAPYIAASTSFENGITNGYAWYEVLGGMQDWSDNYYRDLQITIELSDNKWPSYSKVDYYWKQNRKAMLTFINRVQSVP